MPESKSSFADLREPTSVSQAARPAEQLSDRAQEAARLVAQQYREKAQQFRETAREKYQSTRGRVSHIIEERPVAVGIAGLAIGVIVGLATSNALRGDGFLGKTRENIKRRTREFVEGTREKAGRIAHQAGKAAREEAERQHLITH